MCRYLIFNAGNVGINSISAFPMPIKTKLNAPNVVLIICSN